MPVTTREGIFAVYQPEVAFGATPLPPIHVLTPTTVQKNFILAMGLIYPTVFGAGLGIASGVLHDKGYEDASKVLLYLQYSNWVLILWAMAVMFFYYGLKYTFILRANIIIAETALKAPRAAFGIGNLKSRSPARFLFIQLQITGFGGCAVTVLAGSLCMIWVIFRDRILDMQQDRWPHVMAVLWTCAIALAFFVCLALIAAQSIRSRRRSLNEPSTTTLSHSGPSTAQKSSSNRNSKQGAQQGGVHGSDPEARLTQQYSYDDQSSVDSEKHSMERLDRYIGNQDDLERAAAAASVAAMAHLSERMDREDYNGTTPRSGPPASTSRPLTIQINSGNASTNVNGHSNIRESVFGGRTAREETTGLTSPSHGFTLPSFPLVAMRSGSRNSVQPRPSTSSTNHTSSGTHTASTTSSRFSFGSNKRASLVSAQGQQQQQQQQPTPLSPTSPISPTAYNPNLHLSLQQQTQQQLQQLQAQQDQSAQGRTTMQRIQVKAGGAFQPIPEQYSPAESSYSGDLLYTDALRLQQQQQQQPPSQSTTSPRISAQRGKSSAKAQPSPNLGPSLNSSNNNSNSARYEYPRSNRPISPPPRVSTSSARSFGNNNQFQDPDMQLQQQHPFHQVAYTGLSPPPRSTPLILPLGPSSPSGPTPTSPIRRNGPGLPAVGSSPVVASSQPRSPPLAPASPPFAATQSQEYSPSLRDRALETTTPVAPISPSAFPVGYNTDEQQAPKVGGAVRRSTHSTKSALDSGAAAGTGLAAPPMSPTILASRGPGGGYQSQRPAEPPTTNTSGPIFASLPTPHPAPVAQPKSLRQQSSKFQQAPAPTPAPVPMPAPSSGGGGAYHHHDYGHYNHGDEYDEDHRDVDGMSIDSTGDDSWPMPPSFK